MRLSDPHGMTHTLVTPLVAAFSLCAASTAHAHHSWGAIYDVCNFTIEGRVESIEWKNPHTWFVVKTDAGTLYHVEWTGAPDPRQTGLWEVGAGRGDVRRTRRGHGYAAQKRSDHPRQLSILQG